MNDDAPLHLFAGCGIELEYMIVENDTLDVLPVTDKVLHAVAGAYESEVELEELSWSNELVLHVIELKTNGPVASLSGLHQKFIDHVRRINALLEPLNGRLMPSAMHPWMDPKREMRLWPHDYSPVYEAFNRIFGCQGHGWANLQSVHINLPFANDEEFARLHAAIRLLLPIMPALAASSPMMERQLTGLLDNRLNVYRTNSRAIPSITGKVIPEPVFTQRDYETRILQKIYDDIAPHDPEGILQYEWLNARGAIARFDRNTIEIRVLDMQECPLADLAISAAIVAVLEALAAERWTDLAKQQAWAVEPLEAILLATIKEADLALIADRQYLQAFGFTAADKCTAGELWQHLVKTLFPKTSVWLAPLSIILQRGTLSRRIIKGLGDDLSSKHIAMVYRQLCSCLATSTMFLGSD